MSWIHRLYETYERCPIMVGKIEEDGKDPLLPIGHTLKNAHIQVAIDSNGEFLRASVIPKTKEEAQTIIPSTEESAGRAGKRPESHPLCDSLQFVAGDFTEYGGIVTSGYSKNPKEPHLTFVKKLDRWCQSDDKHEKAISILTYVKKNRLIADLVSGKVLYAEDSKLVLKTKEQLKKYFGSEKAIPEIFQVIQADSKDKTINQGDAFVRWIVESVGERQSKVWEDHSLWDSWANYYSGLESAKGFCYVLGKDERLAEQHPKRIRNGKDGAKLISSNDTAGYTFRGRFGKASQACGVGSDVTQKAHSALRWLISRQGYRNGDQAIVAWSVAGKAMPSPWVDSFEILGTTELASDDREADSTAQHLALKLRNKIAGYKADLGKTDSIVVMGLDSATPGRMAITYYRELTGSEFLERLNYWHESCAWIHDYRFVEEKGDKKGKRKYISFVGAPAPRDIAEAAYGNKADDKLKKTIERILPCIVDGRQIPKDIVDSAVRRASKRICMEDWEWNKTLSIACALYKKLNEKEGYIMSLECNRKTRDYLYGRLLAAADCMEKFALYVSEKKRDTNAARLMQRFADRPCSTWKVIELSLIPYKARLGGRAKKYNDTIDEIMSMFNPPEDFTSDKPLTGEFLLGYHCQREELKPKKNEPENIDDNDQVAS